MRAVIQRVTQASVSVEGSPVAAIKNGLLILLAIARDDSSSDVDWMVRKTIRLRIFSDSAGKMNLDIRQSLGELLVVSQFTLYGDCSRGTRPSFDRSAPAELAEKLYLEFLTKLAAEQVSVKCGIFKANMQVNLINDGPVTLVLESKGMIE